MVCSWDDLPTNMRTEEVRPYYDALKKKRAQLAAKRLFDIVVSLLLLVLLSPVFAVLAVVVKVDSPGPVFFRQTRVTQYGRLFRIVKIRTMRQDAESVGALVTSSGDSRITRVGSMIRKCRLDEIGQLVNVLKGEMSFVGTRPEVPRYVEQYAPEMMATLLLPAGVTSRASIEFKDEDEMISGSDNVDEVYVRKVLPLKMAYNLDSLMNFSFLGDIKTMFATISAVLE